MVQRICNLPKTQSFFLFGARQTGKSTLIASTWTQKIWKVDLLHHEQFLKYSKHPDLFRKEVAEKVARQGIKTVFVDEIQRVPEILNEVHALLESIKCQFILTGSSARKLKRGGGNLLAGRAVQRFLFPFVYAEVSDDFDLEKTLRLGSLPAIYGKSEEEAIDVLRSYTETYLREEIQWEGLTRNLGGFSRFLDIAAALSGELVNFTDLAREAQLTARTVQSYYQILEETLIGIHLHPWRTSTRKRLTAHPKFFLFDLGVTNSINRRLQHAPDPVLRGRLFEQWLILETYRLLSYRLSEARMFYWRTNTGNEVDLLLEKHGKIEAAVEFKSTRAVSGRDLSGLRSFQADYPKTPLFLVADVDEPYQLESVRVLPWRHYLTDLLGEIL